MTNRNNSQYSFGKKHRYLNKAQQGIKFQPININDYRYDDSGKIVNNKTGQTGTLASSEVLITAKRPPVINRLLQSVTNGIIGASVADAPAIATAGGWKRDNNGNWIQQPDAGTQKLADNLADISAMSPTNYGTALVDNAIKYLPKAILYGAGKYGNGYVKNLARAKIFSNQMKKAHPVKFEYYNFTPQQIVTQKRQFAESMDKQGLQFKEFDTPYLTPKTIQMVLANKFFDPKSVGVIVPKKNSNIRTYLKWMDTTFNVHTPKEAYAYPANEFNRGITGYYDMNTKKAGINTAFPDIVGSTFIHELGSHGTDNEVASRLIKDYPYEIKTKDKHIDPSVRNIYQDIANIKPNKLATIKYKLQNFDFSPTSNINKSKSSKYWYEARATLNELRQKLFKYKNPRIDYETGNLVPISPEEYQRDFENTLNQIPDIGIIKTIGTISTYGKDYQRAYDLLTDKQKKQWMDKVRYALKYLPVSGAGYIVSKGKNDK